jgi:protein-tyrosine sulfotransferase
MKKIKLARFLIWLIRLLPLKHPIKSEKELPQPFFIFGSGRNGSSLINLLLNQHPNIFLPTEQYFLGNTILKFQIYNHLIWRDLAKILAGELIPTLNSHTWQLKHEQLFSKIVASPKQEQTLQHLIYTIYAEYAAQLGQPFKIWGDSTFVNTQYCKDIYRVYPNAKFLFLIRDGRDVAASFKAGGLEAFDDWATPLHAAKHWNESIEKLKWLKRKTANVLLVKYEDLVSKPEITMVLVFNHLGESYPEDIFDFHKKVPKSDFYNPEHHQKLQQPIDSKSIGQWKERLTKTEIEQITSVLAKNLSKFGYV